MHKCCPIWMRERNDVAAGLTGLMLTCFHRHCFPRLKERLSHSKGVSGFSAVGKRAGLVPGPVVSPHRG
jgi:hypothetical protein